MIVSSADMQLTINCSFVLPTIQLPINIVWIQYGNVVHEMYRESKLLVTKFTTNISCGYSDQISIVPAKCNRQQPSIVK